MDQPTEAFRWSLPRVIAVILAVAIPITVAGILLIDGWNTDIPALLATIVTQSLIAVVLAPVVAACQKVYVRPDRLRGCNVWGFHHDLEWEDFKTIRPFNLLGLRYIRLRGKRNARVIWLPLFLVNMSRFKELVAQYTESNNPLNQYLEQNVR